MSVANKTVVLILTFIIIRSGGIGSLNFEKEIFDSHLESYRLKIFSQSSPMSHRNKFSAKAVFEQIKKLMLNNIAERIGNRRFHRRKF